MLAWAPLLISAGIVIVPSGMAGVRVSQTKGTLAGTLYPGVHFVMPLVERVELFNTRDQLFTTGISEDSPGQGRGERQAAAQALHVQAKEGLTLGLAITVRYQIDPKRLDYIEANLPQPLEKEIVPPVVATAWRELVPGYTVREVFSAKREEVRQRSAEMIRKRLAADGIVVKEVMLRDIELPQEYAKGLESLLLKEQENDRMGVETEIHQKQVKIAEADAEATKVQEVKQAEGQAAVRVLQAKGESDAMQYTLPLKQKQIEQSKLEAEARKEATVKNAEAAGEAKLIDSKAERERRKLLAQAEAERIRLTASADAERMTSESRDPEAESAADQQDRRRAPLRQVADHDGPGRRQVFLHQRRAARHGRSEPRKPGRRRGRLRGKTATIVAGHGSQFSVNLCGTEICTVVGTENSQELDRN